MGAVPRVRIAPRIPHELSRDPIIHDMPDPPPPPAEPPAEDPKKSSPRPPAGFAMSEHREQQPTPRSGTPPRSPSRPPSPYVDYEDEYVSPVGLLVAGLLIVCAVVGVLLLLGIL